MNYAADNLDTDNGTVERWYAGEAGNGWSCLRLPDGWKGSLEWFIDTDS
jgi:hypothetical protein